jgi:hypothetical protein
MAKYLSRNSIYDDVRVVSVENICDADSDGLVEVILRDSVYAGYSFLIEKFSPDFSEIKEESVDGSRGD